MDYSELIAEVTERTGISSVATRAAMYTGMAEAMLNKRLRVAEAEAETALLTDAEGYTALPSGFQAARAVHVGTTQLPAAHLDDIIAGRAGYAVIGNDLRTSCVDTEITLNYYRALTPLAIAGTNWLLEAEPEIYLYAVMRQAFMASLDAEKATAAQAILDQLIDAKISADRTKRFLDTPYRIAGMTP